MVSPKELLFRNVKTVLAAAALAALTHQAASQESFVPNLTLSYKTVDDLDLEIDVFLPDGHHKNDHRPAIVFFHGGGWRNGTPAQFHPHATYLADRGMVVFSVQYRLENVNGTDPRACVRDGKSAMRWVRKNASNLGINPDRIAAGGGSAGGHIAAATALLAGFNEESDDLSIDCRPNALVLFNPVFDNGPNGYGYERVEPYWESISPLHNIAKGAPPTVVFLGTRDKLIPVATAEDYRDRVQSVGARCELHLYEDRGHGFFNHSNPPYYEKTVTAMDAFLVSLGYLEPIPTQ